MTDPTTVETSCLLETLLPGDPPFPAAGGLGIEGVVLERLRRLAGEDAPDRLRQSIIDCGGPLEGRDEVGRTAIVGRLERLRPVLFEALIKAAYLTYYGRVEVEAAFRASGLEDYARAPQPRGYALEPFDPDRDTPRHGRGAYVATEAVQRVELPEGLVP